ncbi:MAG TPA: amidohydrolase family protein [Vicinamibacterales bacterium]|nr:amidohydrolase family protein [Vicinamibacterales bacterium]
MRILLASFLVALVSMMPAGQQPASTQSNVQASLIEVPPGIPSDAARYTVTMMGNRAGTNIVWRTPDGMTHAFFAFNDRGRGPRITETYASGTDGLLRSFELTGNDYYKTPVSETFSVSNGQATWKNQAEQGAKAASRALYVPLNGGVADAGILVKAALAQGGSVALLPEGEARVERVLQRELHNGGNTMPVSLYAISGLDLTPNYVWVDDHNDLFAAGASWMMTIRDGWESSAADLQKAQTEVERVRAESLAAKLEHKSASPVAIQHVALFDSTAGVVVPDQTVIVSGTHIDRVGAAADVQPPSGATVIDGRGKTLLPGLWDMHAHVAPNDGMMNLAVGVTTVRDLANDTDELEARRKRIDAGKEIGTRIFPAGFIDGPGPYQGPTKILASTEQQARDYVRWYAGLGYRQIKIYSSLNPALVPAIVDEAHKHGMRVSGHIPAGMTASDGVRAGMDEIQHANFLMLNFMPDVKDKTMTPVRFTEVARRGAAIDVNGEPMRDFIALLKDHHVAIDPTVAIFEEMFVNRAGKIPESYTDIAPRLPAQFRRGLLGGGLPVPEGMDQTFKDTFANMLRLVKVMYDAGIPVESGTDSIAGFTLERELELHVKAGIPAPRVLADATLGAARIMKADDQLGSITAGKLADLVLIDGHPETNISDIRRPTLVMKDGVIYYPNELDRELGIGGTSR